MMTRHPQFVRFCVLLLALARPTVRHVGACMCASTPAAAVATTTTPSTTTSASTSTTTSSSTSTTTSTTTTTTTTTAVCACPAGTSGVIFNAADSQFFIFNMPAATFQCAGCPNGLTEACYPTQASNMQANDVANTDVQCNNGDYTNFCACPSDGTACYTFTTNTAVNDVQLYSFCDTATSCNTYLVFFSGSNTDAISNGATTITFVGQLNAAQTAFQPFSPTATIVKAPAIAVSCNGCTGISTNNAQTGTAVTCSGPLNAVTG